MPGSAGTEGGRIDTGQVESSIRPELERQLQVQVPDATISVDDVSCVASGTDGGSCVASVSDIAGRAGRLLAFADLSNAR